MPTELRREEFHPPQPQLDEGYWESLLTEGEFARSSTMEPPEPTATVTNGSRPLNADMPPVPETTPPPNDWEEIAHIMEADEVLHLKVVGYNRGGLLVEWKSLRGFVPASQLLQFPLDQAEEHERRDALVERVGDVLRLRVIELDPEKNRLILSERAAQVAAGTREEVISRLEPGSIAEGTVTNLCDFGAFVDLGGIEGLIHISELSWGRVGHPADVLTRGQTVRVYVLDIAPDQGRIALSTKRLHPDPWATVDERYVVGQIVEGRITNVVDFGAFACVEEGLEGLIHFSELAEGHFLHPRNVVEEGEIVQVRILSIDGKARRLGLSLRLA